ncbi:MAG: hypothetical protein NC403_07745 [Muribaculaceae bacterium]|nr:hypothetical protein [Muribaculaceae bacterium]
MNNAPEMKYGWENVPSYLELLPNRQVLTANQKCVNTEAMFTSAGCAIHHSAAQK